MDLPKCTVNVWSHIEWPEDGKKQSNQFSKEEWKKNSAQFNLLSPTWYIDFHVHI